MNTFLKSTNQQVFPMPWAAQAPCPWNRQTHERVVRPHDLTPKGNRAEVMVVRKEKLLFVP
jgi:hypothetical protein